MLRSKIADMLDEAKKLTIEAEKNLHDPFHECTGCGGKRYANFSHHTMKEVLTGAIGRLEKTSSQLRHMGGDSEDVFGPNGLEPPKK